MESLCLLITQTPLLRTLSLSLSASFPVWQEYLNFGDTFVCALMRLPSEAWNMQWEHMTTLRIEGMTNTGPLIIRCPNLKGLHLTTPNGFSKAECDRIIYGLHLSPNLLSFSLSPKLGLFQIENNALDTTTLLRIGRALPRLQSLDLRTYASDYYSKRIQFYAYNKSYGMLPYFILSGCHDLIKA
jgi:hypothetical protein